MWKAKLGDDKGAKTTAKLMAMMDKNNANHFDPERNVATMPLTGTKIRTVFFNFHL
jgi:hypothetical protein